jgi:thioredoxin 1
MVHEFSSADPSILSNGTVIVDFYAEWCNPCKKYAPKFIELSEEFISFTFVKVNTDEHEGLQQKYMINSLPTTLVLVNGKDMDRVEGYDLQEIRAMIEKFKH